MNPLLNVLTLAVGALALLALVRGFTWAKDRWAWLRQAADSDPLFVRILFIAVAAGVGLALHAVGAVLPSGLQVWLPSALESILLAAAGGAVTTGAYAQARKERGP